MQTSECMVREPIECIVETANRRLPQLVTNNNYPFRGLVHQNYASNLQVRTYFIRNSAICGCPAGEPFPMIRTGYLCNAHLPNSGLLPCGIWLRCGMSRGRSV